MLKKVYLKVSLICENASRIQSYIEFIFVCVEVDKGIVQVDWDTKLDTPFSKRCLKILSEFEEVSFAISKRSYYLFDINDSFINIQVISFNDASSRRYDGLVYLSFESKSGMVKSSLVSSKFKTSSINGNVTIPRLQLNAVLIMSQITVWVLMV